MNSILIDQGQGDPAFVFIHGFLCAPDDWIHQIKHFSSMYRAVAPTLRGHNGSPRGSDILSIPRLAKDCISIFDDLELKKIILVGHSMGTRVALEIARLITDNVAGIVLLDGSRISGSSEKNVHLDRFRDQVQNSDYENFITKTFSAMVSNPAFVVLRERLVARALRVPQEWAVELRCNTIRYDSDTVERAVMQVSVPLLVIQSTDKVGDRIYRPLKENDKAGYSSFIEATSNHSDVVILSGTGHFSQLEVPDRINSSIEAWMKRCQIV